MFMCFHAVRKLGRSQYETDSRLKFIDIYDDDYTKMLIAHVDFKKICLVWHGVDLSELQNI